MQAWKIFGFGLFAALWMACETGAINLGVECVSNAQCPEGQSCESGVCLIIAPLSGIACDEDTPCVEGVCEEKRCVFQCRNGSDDDCADGICESRRCIAPQCSNDGDCDVGLCESNRCVSQCDKHEDCSTSEVCEKGVCKPLVCATSCTREEACVPGDADNPTEGQCVSVECKDAGGIDLCDLATQRCVNAKDPENPTKGECRNWCRVPSPVNVDPCGSGMACVGIEEQEVDELGTCEDGCFRNLDCGEWETCEGADASELTTGTCEEVPLGDDACRDDDDCTDDAKPNCMNADSATLTLGTCEA